MKDSNCYEYAAIFEDELVNNMFGSSTLDFSNLINRAQVAQVKIQTSFEACGVDTMIALLDKRMSNLDFTLAFISNIMAQVFAGFESQNWTGYIVKETGKMHPNPVNNMIYNAYNEIYPYFLASDWENFGRYGMNMVSGLLNFQSQTVEADA